MSSFPRTLSPAISALIMDRSHRNQKLFSDEEPSRDEELSSDTPSDIAPIFTAERSMKTALGEFIDALNMYYEMDQKYDGK